MVMGESARKHEQCVCHLTDGAHQSPMVRLTSKGNSVNKITPLDTIK